MEQKTYMITKREIYSPFGDKMICVSEDRDGLGLIEITEYTLNEETKRYEELKSIVLEPNDETTLIISAILETKKELLEQKESEEYV